VVPPGPEFADPYRSAVVDGYLTGRGTADTKGNLVMLAAAWRFLADSGRAPTRQVELDLVIEEEIGGNGALSALLHGRTADEVVVLEPTGLEVFHGHRGCLEFAATLTGRSSHMGGAGISAIDGAMEFLTSLKELEAMLIAQARRDPSFTGWDRPVQINVGAIDGGEWHGSIPERCRLRCSFGFHPRYGLADVRAMLEDLVARLPSTWFREHTALTYTGIHNGAYLADPAAPVARDLSAAVRSAGGEPAEGRAWNVSCDARLYHRLLGVPTVVFGAGSLAYAHSSTERLEIAEWDRGVAALARFLTTANAGQTAGGAS
jgi:acetylornithine deacetylase